VELEAGRVVAGSAGEGSTCAEKYRMQGTVVSQSDKCAENQTIDMQCNIYTECIHACGYVERTCDCTTSV
jgi:hypothetical protein